jgi:hypothetical protein
MTTTLLDLDRLRRLAPPPEMPLEPGHPARWPAVEATLGTTLPDDYKEFVTAYGTGTFDDFLSVFTPFAVDSDGNLLCQRDVAPPPACPGPDSLLPVGRTQNGDQIFWSTEGEPDGWPVVALASSSTEPERHELGLVPFLSWLLGGTLATAVFPPELGEGVHLFTPG